MVQYFRYIYGIYYTYNIFFLCSSQLWTISRGPGSRIANLSHSSHAKLATTPSSRLIRKDSRATSTMRALLQLARRLPSRRRPSNATTTANGSILPLRSIAGVATQRLAGSRFSTSTLRWGTTAAAAAVDSTDVLEDDRAVQIQWEDGRTSHYDFTWLRVNCPSCLHESGQRTVFPGDLGADLKPTAVRGEMDERDDMVSIRTTKPLVPGIRATMRTRYSCQYMTFTTACRILLLFLHDTLCPLVYYIQQQYNSATYCCTL